MQEIQMRNMQESEKGSLLYDTKRYGSFPLSGLSVVHRFLHPYLCLDPYVN